MPAQDLSGELCLKALVRAIERFSIVLSLCLCARVVTLRQTFVPGCQPRNAPGHVRLEPQSQRPDLFDWFFVGAVPLQVVRSRGGDLWARRAKVLYKKSEAILA